MKRGSLLTVPIVGTWLQTSSSHVPTFGPVPYQPTTVALRGRAVVGRRIRELRTQRGMTQEALAAAAGMDRSFLVDVETGRHSLMLDRLFDLAAALNASAADLIADS